MLSERFTILELTDLALRVPEIGAVNFNILHTVLTSLILQVGADGLKPACHIEDETLAQAAITKARMEHGTRKASKILTIKEMKERVRELVPEQPSEEESLESIPGSETTTEVAEETVEKQADESSSASLGDREIKEMADEGPGQEQGGQAAESKDVDESELSMGVDENQKSKDADESEKSKEADESDKSKEADESEEMEEAEKSITDETKGSDADSAKTEGDQTEQATISDLQAAARDLMEQTADVFVEKVAVVTDALRVLEDEDLLDSEPARVMEEVWRATNINRRMEAAEAGLRELSSLVDVMLDKVQDMEDQSDDVMRKTRTMIDEISKFLERIKILEETAKTLSLRIDDCNEQRANEVERLEGILKEMMKDQEETKTALENLQSSHDDLADRVAYKEDLEEAKSYMSEVLEESMKDMRKLLREVEDTLVKKEDFMELVNRVEEIEESKVSREELGRLLEPGFIDSFLNEQANLRTELEDLKLTVSELQENFNALKTRIDEEIVKTMESNFANINGMLDDINVKLAQLDPDEINDSFANLEEQAAMIIKELEEMKATAEQFQKEAKINFNKISNVNELLNRLDQTKADKAKVYDLLEQKADLDMLMNKLDRSEFVAVVGDMKEDLERLTVTVKINEDEMNQNFLEVRQELTLKMYTEDFITATEPMRNRIKALMYELERVKQISLTHLFPDAPGVVKCISCKHGAHLAGPKFLGDAHVELLQELPPKSSTKISSSKSSKYKTSTSQDTSDVKLPPIDLDSVPIPPQDQPREKDALRLPVLFASARPNIGLTHEKRRTVIDKKLAAYFATRPVRPCEGEYTRTSPQQRGIAFTTFKIPQTEKEEVLLEGIDRKIYKGTVYDGNAVDDGSTDAGEQQETAKENEPAQDSAKEKPDIPSLKEPKRRKGFIKPDIRSRSRKSRESVSPSIVSLHVDDEPLQKTSPLSKSSQSVSLPSRYTL